MNSTTTPERFLPRIPLIYLIGLMTVCAILMGIIQQAVTHRQMWSILMTVAIACVLLPVLIYVGSFSIASLFATVGQAAVGTPEEQRVHQPATEMPTTEIPSAGHPLEGQQPEQQSHGQGNIQ